LTPKGVKDFTQAATGSKEAAQDAESNAIMAALARKQALSPTDI
jgi:hypothetical protein